MSRIWWVLAVVLIMITVGCLSQDGLKKTSPEVSENTLPPPATVNENERNTSSTAEDVVMESEDISDIEYSKYLSKEYILCLNCHGDVKRFHDIETVNLLDMKKGVNPRLCIVCHGQKIHDIHWILLNEEHITCDTCHNKGGEFVVPEAEGGQLLVCEVCHSAGNYIKIHIEGIILEDAPIDDVWIKKGSHHECDTCHVGSYGTIHFDPLASWRDDIEEIMNQAESTEAVPLNISYA